MTGPTPWTSGNQPPPDIGERCTATNRAGGRCRRAPTPGAEVCWYHGGAAGSPAATAATKRITKQQAEALAVTFGLPVETTAEDALYEELYRSVGIVRWVQQRVQQLAPEALIWGDVEVLVIDKTATEYPGVDRSVTEGAAVHVWVQLLFKERQHLLNVAHKIAALNLEERRVRIDEGKATVLTAVLRAVLGEYGLKLGDGEVAGHVQRHLKLVTAAHESDGAS